MRVAGDDLEEAVLARDERLVVDAHRVHLSEAELAPLRQKSAGSRDLLVDLLVLVAGRSAVDDDRGPLEGGLGVVEHLVADRFEVRGLVGIDRQPGAARDEVVDLRPLGRHRSPLVKRDLVDAEVLAEVGEQPDQGLPDGARADDVDDLFHSVLLFGASDGGGKCGRKDTMRRAFRQPRRESVRHAALRRVPARPVASKVCGRAPSSRGADRPSFAHPHPLHGGTMHNKVVYRAAQALTRAGYATLRFNFRGVGLSEGRHDSGRGEVEDFRAALDEAERSEGLPIVAAGFSFGGGDGAEGHSGGRADRRRASRWAFPWLRNPDDGIPRPAVPALFVVGEQDPFGPPEDAGALSRGDRPPRRRPGRRSLLRGIPRDRRGNHHGVSRRPPARRTAERGLVTDAGPALRRRPPGSPEAGAPDARSALSRRPRSASGLRPLRDLRRSAGPLRHAARRRSASGLHRNPGARGRPDADDPGVRPARGLVGPAVPSARGLRAPGLRDRDLRPHTAAARSESPRRSRSGATA